jgi:hypothetical protein
MSESELVAALRPVVEALDILGARYFVGGSVASSAHGIARASLDADVVVALDPLQVDQLIERLHTEYYVPVDRLRAAVIEKSSCNLIHLATMFKIDLFISKGRPFDREAASRARPEPLDDAPHSPRFLLASPEDTVLSKLEWFRAGNETSERQWWDIVGVLRVTGGADQEYLRRWAASLGVADLLERALAQALA